MTLEELLNPYNEAKSSDNRTELFINYLNPFEDAPNTQEPESESWWYFKDYMRDNFKASMLGIAPIEQPDAVKEVKTGNLDDKKLAKKIKDTDSEKNYKLFKTELNKFIQKNPEYKDMAKFLEGFACLESSYNQFAINEASNALGWFQFLDSTRKDYNKQSREEFVNDAQEQLRVAAKHFTSLRKQVKSWGGDPEDFALLYAAWWRPESAKLFIKDPTYDYVSPHGERFSNVYKKAKKLMI